MSKPTTAEIRERICSTKGINHDDLMELSRILLDRLEAAEAKMCGGLPAVGGHDDCHASQFKKTIRDLEATIAAISELQRYRAFHDNCRIEDRDGMFVLYEDLQAIIRSKA